MKNIFKYFKTVRKELLILLAIAIAGYFTIELILNNFTELFKGASKVGQFFSKLSISYISAFIFYFIVVHIKSENDKENINEYVGIKVSEIVTSGHLFLQPLLQTKQPKSSIGDFSPAEIKKILRTINRNSPDSPLKFSDDRIGTWLEWFEYLKEGTLNSIKEIFARYNHVDTKLIKLLSRIENSMLFYQWNMLYIYHPIDPTFGMFEYQLLSYVDLINELEKYAQKNYRPSGIVRGEFYGINKYIKY